jgi:DNA polymerase-4
MQRRIMHLDMDAFYASVEQADRPELRGKPVIVGGSTRGVVSAASYEARTFGVRSAMPMFRARGLCPYAVVLPVRMERYKEMSRKVMAILTELSPLVEKVSIDEAFLDVTGTERLYGPPEDLGRLIKDRVYLDTGLTCSIGVAPARFLAKIASDLDKPDGLVILREEDVPGFMRTLPVTKIPGIGGKTAKRLEELGVKTAGDVLRQPQAFWRKRFGSHGLRLHERARGIDPSPVVPTHERKSLGAENTFDHDLADPEEIKSWLLAQAERVGYELRKHGCAGKTVTLKIKFSDFRTITRSHSLPEATDNTAEIYNRALDLLSNVNLSKKVRLTGVSVSNLHCGLRQASLFPDENGQRQKQLDRAMDRVHEKFGRDALKRGRLFDFDGSS